MESGYRLDGRVILITGGCGALGYTCMERCLDMGALGVAVCDVEVVGTLERLQQHGYAMDRVMVTKVDVSNSNQVKQWIDSVYHRWGRIDGLLNNAAAFVFGKIEEVTEEQWDTVLNTNVKGYAYCIKHVIPHMRKGGGGSIVNMSSQSAHIAQPAFTPYNTSKGAIEQLSKCVALDYGCENIRCNTVCPGTIRTPATLKHAEKLGITVEELTKITVADLCLKRLGTPDDVAGCVIFLLSSASAYVTGSSLMVDGGYTTK